MNAQSGGSIRYGCLRSSAEVGRSSGLLGFHEMMEVETGEKHIHGETFTSEVVS